MIAGMTYYQIAMFFLIYSFAGWVLEVTFHAVVLGKVINRGFLNGPVCPVYGFGMLAVFSMVNLIPAGPSGDAPLGILFLGGMALTTLIELIAGWILDVAFHARWWDYSDKPFNFHGYICLSFSILWGLAVVLAVRVAHPLISRSTVDVIPEHIGWILMAFLYAGYFADFIITVATIRGLNKKLAEIDAIRAKMRIPSDRMSQTIATTAIRTSEQLEEGRVQAALGMAELKEYSSEKYEEAQLKAQAARRELSERAASVRRKSGEISASMMQSVSSVSSTVKQGASTASATVRQSASAASAAVKQGASAASATVKQGASAASAAVKQGASAASATVKQGASAASATVKQGASAASATVKQGASVASATVKQGVSVVSSSVKQSASSAKQNVRQKSAEMLSRQADHASALMQSIVSHHHFGMGRFLKAFPKMKHRDYPELLEELKDMLK